MIGAACAIAAASSTHVKVNSHFFIGLAPPVWGRQRRSVKRRYAHRVHRPMQRSHQNPTTSPSHWSPGRFADQAIDYQ